MKSFQYVIKDELGIHARPAGILAKEAKKFDSAIRIKKGDKEVAVSQLLMLMGLGVKKNDEITVTVDGADEEEAFAVMESFFQENL